jgi:hypothetical protein
MWRKQSNKNKLPMRRWKNKLEKKYNIRTIIVYKSTKFRKKFASIVQETQNENTEKAEKAEKQKKQKAEGRRQKTLRNDQNKHKLNLNHVLERNKNIMKSRAQKGNYRLKATREEENRERTEENQRN